MECPAWRAAPDERTVRMAEGAISGKTWCPRGFVTIEEALAQIDLGLDGRLGEDVRAAIRRLSAHREQMPDDLGDLEDDIASLSTIGGLASVVNDYPAFDFSEAAAGEAPAADGRLHVFTVYHGNMRQDCTGGHVSWYFEDDGTMPESYLSRERAEEKFREWSGDLQGEFDREAACRGGRPTVMMARTGYGVELRQEVWERDEDGEWTIATDDLGLMESETLDTASYTLDDHLAAIERQEREQEQGYDLASACRESCLAADALAEDEKNDLDGRDDR